MSPVWQNLGRGSTVFYEPCLAESWWKLHCVLWVLSGRIWVEAQLCFVSPVRKNLGRGSTVFYESCLQEFGYKLYLCFTSGRNGTQAQPSFDYVLPWKSGYSSLVFLPSFLNSVRSPNSWTYNFIELSGHNLESSQTWSFWMDLLNIRYGGMVFYQVFLLSPLQCTVTEL